MSHQKIYVSVTTLVDWEKKLEEIKELHIKEVAIFLTGLPESEEDRFFQLLSLSGVESVPFVHLRNTTSPERIKFLKDRYHTSAFNIHIDSRYQAIYDLSEFKDEIFVENTGSGFEFPERISEYAGICADFAHLENERLLRTEEFEAVSNELSKHKIGCAHISAITEKSQLNWDGKGDLRFDSHHYSKLAEFDYLKRYEEYLPDIMAIELNDSIKKQLEVKKYLEKILKI